MVESEAKFVVAESVQPDDSVPEQGSKDSDKTGGAMGQ